MNDIFELMKNRCSCRNFADKPIPADLLDKLLDASVSGPSSGGFQNYSVIKVTKPEEKMQLAQCCRGQSFIGKAAVDLIYCIDLHRERRIAEALHAVPDTQMDYMKLVLLTIDAAVAAQNFCIAAESCGIGTVSGKYPLSFWNGYYYAGAEGVMTQDEHKRFVDEQGFSFLK